MLTPLATGVSLITEADLGYTSVPRYVRNTTFSATARSALRWKFGLGAFAPGAFHGAGQKTVRESFQFWTAAYPDDFHF